MTKAIRHKTGGFFYGQFSFGASFLLHVFARSTAVSGSFFKKPNE
jgi:hypothetical protein